MNREQLVRETYLRCRRELPISRLDKAIDAMLEIAVERLINGETVSLAAGLSLQLDAGRVPSAATKPERRPAHSNPDHPPPPTLAVARKSLAKPARTSSSLPKRPWYL